LAMKLDRLPDTGDAVPASGTGPLFQDILNDLKPYPSYHHLFTLRTIGVFPLMPRNIPQVNVMQARFPGNRPGIFQGFYRC